MGHRFSERVIEQASGRCLIVDSFSLDACNLARNIGYLIMDIIDKEDLFAVQRWLDEQIASDAEFNKPEHEMIVLLDTLLRCCTPYLGRHNKVERALFQFAEQMVYK